MKKNNEKLKPYQRTNGPANAHLISEPIISTKPVYKRVLSPYLTEMRRVRNGFANRFSKPSRTVAKRSHGIAKSSHALRTRHERFAKVLNM